MSDRYQPDRAQGNGSPLRVAEPEAPDFMQLAAGQLRKVLEGIDARVKTIRETSPGESGEWDREVREARLAVADRLIALADIQYNIPAEGDAAAADWDEDYPPR